MDQDGLTDCVLSPIDRRAACSNYSPRRNVRLVIPQHTACPNSDWSNNQSHTFLLLGHVHAVSCDMGPTQHVCLSYFVPATLTALVSVADMEKRKSVPPGCGYKTPQTDLLISRPVSFRWHQRKNPTDLGKPLRAFRSVSSW